MLKFAPSILAADFCRLGEQIHAAESAGADMIHLDIMDGHFVPNLSFGVDIAKASKKACSLVHDAHLMVTHPEHYLDDFIGIGVEIIAFHLEIDGVKNDLGEGRWVYELPDIIDTDRIMNVIGRIKAAGAKAGLTLNPPSDITRAVPFLDEIDLLLLMSVNPGFAGQGFMDTVYEKLTFADAFRRDNHLSFEIMVDGGVDLTNAADLHTAGADILVSGSAFFKSPDFNDFVRRLKS
ncbi:MAG: ribulose-phosphate 3-epimerase [candidate division Zixibacteria bacterium]|nr:ribulose-phosphate 3-epimerase [candidate division Zixibacteria bacterium]